MLGKLMKYDMKYMARVLPWLYLGAFGMSLFMSFILYLSAKSSSEALMVTVALGILPISLMIGALSVCGTVFMMIRIYKNMFSDEGYLTFTLPVKTHNIVWSKLLTGAVWNVFGGIVTIAVIAMPVTTVLVTLAKGDPDLAAELSATGEIAGALLDMLPQGPGFVTGLISFILNIVVALFSSNALFMLSCCLAQMLNKSRGIASVGIYLGMNFLLSSITSASSRITLSLPAEPAGDVYIPEMQYYYSVLSSASSTSLVTVLITAAVTALAIFFSCRIVKKKLNMI